MRNASVELLRLLLIFGICVLHASCQGLNSTREFPTNILQVCVPCFVFISGYYGIRFSWRKVANLYFIAILAVLIAPMAGAWWLRGGYWSEIVRIWDAPSGFWFLHAYAMLMMISPCIEKAYVSCETSKEFAILILPIIFFTLLWGWLSNFRHLEAVVPHPQGINWGLMPLLGVYAWGTLCRKFDLQKRLKLQASCLVLLILLMVIILTGSRLSQINSPLVIALATCLFSIFEKLKLPVVIGKIVLALSPLSFGIYCVHGTIYFPFTDATFFSIIEYSKGELLNFGPCTACMGAALVAFLVGGFVSFCINRAWKLVLLIDKKTKEICK